jgi:hypothetical protein
MFQEEDRPSQSDLAKLIKAFGSRLTHFGPRKAEETKALATMFDLKLPSDYRQFLGSYGAVDVDDLQIFGLVGPDRADLAAENITLMLRLVYDDMPLELIPVEELGNNHYACLLCPKQKSDDSPVVIIDIDNRTPIDQLIVLAPGFRDYLYNRLLLLLEPSTPVPRNEQDIQKALKVFEKHVLHYHDQFQYDHATGGKLPRNHDWRPYRYCIQDVVFGITVVRHLQEANCLQVDVFLTAEIPEYDPLAGAVALTSFLLSEAYKCGGTMEIRFTREVGQVPQELQALAGRYDIDFKQAENGRIEANEAKALYAALTEFSPELQTRINELEQAGKVKMARACYVVHHGVWTKEQVEMIVLGSENPDSILGGQTQPHQRHLYYHDLLHTRAALLGGMLDRVLVQRERVSDAGIEYDMEDDVRPLEIQFDGLIYAKQYHSEEVVPIPWLYPQDQKREIQGGMTFNILIRARDAADMQLHLSGDIKQAEAYRTQTQQPTLILLPQDFMILSEDFREQFHHQAKTAKVGLLICPDPIMTFDADATQRLARSRILRQ